MRIEELSELPVISATPGAPLNVFIASGDSTTDAIDLGVQRLYCIFVPSTWVDASISFSVSPEGTTWYDLYDTDGEVVVADGLLATGRAVVIDMAAFFGVRFIKLRSGTASAPVVQTNDCVLTLLTVAR